MRVGPVAERMFNGWPLKSPKTTPLKAAQTMFSIAEISPLNNLCINAPNARMLVMLAKNIRITEAIDCVSRPRKKSVKSET